MTAPDGRGWVRVTSGPDAGAPDDLGDAPAARPAAAPLGAVDPVSRTRVELQPVGARPGRSPYARVLGLRAVDPGLVATAVLLLGPVALGVGLWYAGAAVVWTALALPVAAAAAVKVYDLVARGLPGAG